jgi:glycine/D-amino acid oxidase-like deaminating enzyme
MSQALSPSAWEDSRWTALPHLSGTARADACVIGLGGSGLSVIHALFDHGISAIGIDAGPIAGGAAGSNGGFLLAGTARFYHRVVEQLGRARASELYRMTVLEIERMQRELPNYVRAVGSLRIATSAEELADCAQQFESMTTDQIPVEHYRGNEGEGLLIPTDAVFNPLARCRQLAYTALERGARLYEHTPALTLQSGLVQTPQARIHCKHIIVAVDGRLDALFPELAGRVRTSRLQMLGTAATNEVRFPRAVYARFGYEYWQQLPDGRIVLGGFRDHGGDDEWTQSTETSEIIQSKLERFLREQLGVNAPITHRWAASVGYTENGLPIIEELRPGIWAIGGYNGTGNVVGALCGRAVAEKIATSRSRWMELLRSD